MQIAVIVDQSAGPIADVIGRVRKAGFSDEMINLFVQPTSDLQGLSLDNVFLRWLKKEHSYNELWRNIVHWWSRERNQETHLCILDGSCLLCDSAADTLKLAVSTNVAWGLISLFVPDTQSVYFAESATGWNGVSLPMPLVGSCLSRHAADMLVKDPLVWSTKPDSIEFLNAVTGPLVRRSLLQAAHYPSLMNTTRPDQPRGLNYRQEAIYVKAAERSL